jgi:hypothetical protein
MRLLSALLLPLLLSAQPARQPLELRSPVQDKAFYVLSALERAPVKDSRLEAIAARKRAALQQPGNLIEAMRWTPEEIATVSAVLAGAAHLDAGLRATGLYPKEPLLPSAWEGAAAGMNRIFDVYGLGKPPRYPAIDAVSFDVKSPNYGRMLEVIRAVMSEEPDGHPQFFHAPLRFALELLRANWRDEAGRFEPMERGENRAAFERVKSIDWSRYKYSAILVPGSGTDRPGQALSPWGKARVTLAARRYKAGLAPFLIVSGGYVHPAQTPFCEALEMKKALMAEHGIPAEAIVIEPHARHTTTNVRNAARLLWRYGFPWEKTALITTDHGQSAYIEAPAFAERCRTEIGHVPYEALKRISQFDLEFRPRLEALQLDPLEPLDP